MKRISQFIGAGILSVGLCLIPSVAVFAGDINAQEQRLLDAAGQQYLYNDVMYKATDSAIATARSYLLQDDVDLTKEQVDSALSQIYNLIPDAIAGGYMVPVEKPKPVNPVTPVDPTPTETEAPTEETETETETETEESIEKPTQKPEEEPTETNSTEPEETEEVTMEEIEESTEEAVEVIKISVESLESTEASQESSVEESTTERVRRNKKFVDNVNLMTVALGVIIVAVIAAALVLFQHKTKAQNGKSHHTKRKK
ncbi:MAG: hypothetical protein ACI4EX_03335 [Lachnospiraceae bacterium]